LTPPGGKVITADVNGDGLIDVVAYGSHDLVNSIMVYLNRGDGTFRPAITTSFSARLFSADHPLLFIADFDGDGKPDFLLDQYFAFGYGDGTFTEVYRILPCAPSGIANLLGDSRPEIYGFTGRSMQIASMEGGRGFDWYTWPFAGLVGRLDRTGYSAVVYRSAVDAISVAHPDGTGGYSVTSQPLVYQVEESLLDVDGDGFDDLIGLDVSTRGLLMSRSLGDGRFSSSIPSPLAERIPRTEGDVNGDGLPDPYVDTGAAVSRGDGTLEAGPGGGGGIVALSDIDGDGRADAVVMLWGGAFTVLYNRRVPAGPRAVDLTIEADDLAAPSQTVPYGRPCYTTTYLQFEENSDPPSGGVTISEGGKVLQVHPLSLYSEIDLLTALWFDTLLYLPVGRHALTHEYSGDDSFTPATARTVCTVVKPEEWQLDFQRSTITVTSTATPGTYLVRVELRNSNGDVLPADTTAVYGDPLEVTPPLMLDLAQSSRTVKVGTLTWTPSLATPTVTIRAAVGSQMLTHVVKLPLTSRTHAVRH
jgi:hypothetical protein